MLLISTTIACISYGSDKLSALGGSGEVLLRRVATANGAADNDSANTVSGSKHADALHRYISEEATAARRPPLTVLRAAGSQMFTW